MIEHSVDAILGGDLAEERGDRPVWELLIWAAILGAIGALGIMLFVVAVNQVKLVMWPSEIPHDPFGSPWWTIPLFTVAGLVAGAIYQFLRVKEESIFKILMEGKVDIRSLPGQLANGFMTLISGFSLGPEGPAGLVAGGAATVMCQRARLSPKDSESVSVAGVSGAFGGLFTSPFVGVLMAMELSLPRREHFTRALAMDSIAAVSGFLVFYTLVGINPEVGYIVLPSYHLESWHLLFAVVLGLIGAGMGLFFGLSMKFFQRLMAPLADKPLIRCTLAGLALGVLAFSLPLVLFFGLEQLEYVFEHTAAIGATLLVVVVVARILATTGALASGFVGGPIFPCFFIGGTMGAVLNLLFPEIPLALAAGGLAAAMSAGVLPIPISISIFAVIFLGLSPSNVAPVLTAGVVSYVIIQAIRSRTKASSSPAH